MNRFDKFCNLILQEQFTVTPREVIYKRYGKAKADEMLAKIKELGRDSYLDKKYLLPNYSDKNLDRVIKVVLKDFDANRDIPQSDVADVAPAAASSTNFLGKKFNQQIELNPNHPEFIVPTIRDLQGGKSDINPATSTDILSHETEHTMQPPRSSNQPRLTPEITPPLSELKRWYYSQTGIALDADMTDKQFNDFINYCKKRNIFNNMSYGRQIDFEKLLRTSEGKEVFRRIVKQTPMKSDTRVA